LAQAEARRGSARAARKRLNRARAVAPGGVPLLSKLPVVAVLGSVIILGIAAYRMWSDELAAAEVQVDQMALSAAAYSGRTLETFALTAGRINDHLAELDTRPEDEYRARAHAQMVRLTRALPPGAVAFAIDRDGFPIAASHMPSVPTSVSLADRDFFRALSEAGAPQTHLSRMFVGRFDDLLLVAVSQARLRSGPAGEAFDGLTTISVDPNLIGAGLHRLAGKSGDVISLYRQDGELLSRSVTVEGVPSPEEAEGPIRRHMPQGAAAARFRTRLGESGEEFLVAVRHLEGFPAYAVAARPLRTVSADAWASIVNLLIFGIPATIIVVLLSLRIRREHEALQEANRALALDVAATADRLKRAERFALVGTFEVDLQSGASYRSAEYMGLHGKAPVAAREVHADWVRRLHPDDRETAEARFLEAIDDHSEVTEYGQTYRVVTEDGETRWITARGTVERDGEGRAVLLRGVHADVTSLRTAESALQEADLRLRLTQEAVDIGNWEWARGARRLVLGRKTVALLGFDAAAPAPGWREVARRIHPADRREVLNAVGRAAPDSILRLEFRIVAPDAGNAPPRWIMARGRCLAAEGGRHGAILGIAYDITERKAAEQHAAMLAREVEHRGKNLMTLILGMVRMTEAASVEELRDTLEGRFFALSQTVNLLSRSRWSDAALRDIARQELSPYFTDGELAGALSGPDIRLTPDAAQAVSLALHELTTNAAKYGALSVDGGSLAVAWRLAGQELCLSWTERDGPPVAGAPLQEGFGFVLVRSAIEGRAGGRVLFHWEAAGLRCEITMPHEPVADGTAA
jgi:two-component sensor histidine kinase/PAS domain-containing protein